MRNDKISNLIDRCVQFLRRNSYTEARIACYQSLWKNGVVRYMTENNLDYYDSEVGNNFKMTCHKNGVVRPQDREYIRSAAVLTDILETGVIQRHRYKTVHHTLNGEVGQAMEVFIQHLVELRRSKNTILGYRLYLSEFLSFLDKEGVKSVRTISDYHVYTFISSHPISKTNVFAAIRVLFKYWIEEGIISDDFKDIFDGYKVRRKEYLPSFYTPQEVMKIEQSVERTGSTGKRNYAMLLLASRLGLRASDIAKLRLSEIDWEQNKLVIEMQKTKKIIELPLLTEVGNAIIDYLRYGRPCTLSTNVFISANPPHNAISRGTVCSTIGKIILHSGVETDGKHHGPHSLRHSLASAMLKNGSSMPIISENLGHKDTKSTLTYIKIDLESLKQCSLDVPIVSEDFYNQRGGAFYV